MTVTSIDVRGARGMVKNVEDALDLLESLAVVAKNVDTETEYGLGLKSGYADAYRDAAEIVRNAMYEAL